ncbi:M20 family metallopeptidase [Kiloniella laminariae]|uniref:M20 family metallopeptidase n=1 Tax=Kiloniella laminariae TaxID=454162 RepID=A0ABT4LH69_9PROT|nr:M20 aminoacylase family protein [Kiloniella laminariae]MCZ4280444.1 M20 family metallopeptidase [Kiloniella laminariae]
MPIINRFAELHDEITQWRRELHQNPELLFDVEETASFVADKLKAFGLDEVVTGIGRTGVVGVIKGRNTGSGRVIGLRADMDALPIHEDTGLEYASKVDGKMHACGHDGHTAMLLGAAKYLSETRNFDGSAVVIFQPAEEGGGGGREMVEEGMMDRFGIQEVYGLHNWPGVPVGDFATRPGALMAATDLFSIEITGSGGHAAKPHETIDPIVVGSHIVLALQSIASRNIDPVESVVVSVTTCNAGTAFNVIPEKAKLTGTVRTLSEAVRDQTQTRIQEIVEYTAKALGATAKVDYQRNYPVVVNHEKETAFAADIASEISGEQRVNTNANPTMGGEDFAYMLNARPGSFIFLGNGDTAPVHHPKYNFNDEIIPVGCSYWARLVETAMPANR